VKRFTIQFRYTKPGEKKPGPVQRYVIHANSLEESREILLRQACYPNLQILSIRQT
jgi:hypothetical protein